MKNLSVMILACLVGLFFEARSQNDGVKMSANPSATIKQTSVSAASQNIVLIQDQPTTSGATMNESMAGTEGGMYLEPGWAPGSVTLSNNECIGDILIRYDLYHQQLQFIKDKDTMAFSRPEEASFFILNGEKFIYTDFLNGGIIGKSYFEVLSDGNCKLLLRRIIRYHLDSDIGTAGQDDRFVRECEYYLARPGETARPVKASRKTVLSAFSDKEQQVSGFIDANKLKMNDCRDLIKVVDYYNSLP